MTDHQKKVVLYPMLDWVGWDIQLPLRMKYIIATLPSQNMNMENDPQQVKIRNNPNIWNDPTDSMCLGNQSGKFTDKIFSPLFPLMSESWHFTKLLKCYPILYFMLYYMLLDRSYYEIQDTKLDSETDRIRKKFKDIFFQLCHLMNDLEM
jgi:hypothetical protein